MHHHHTLDDGVQYHDHAESFHIQGSHPDRPEWGPAHYGHDHEYARLTQGLSGQVEATPADWFVSAGSTHATPYIRHSHHPYP